MFSISIFSMKKLDFGPSSVKVKLLSGRTVTCGLLSGVKVDAVK